VRELAELARPIKIDNLFDDPGAICRLVESHGPYPMMSSYLPKPATGGHTPRSCRSSGVRGPPRAGVGRGGRRHPPQPCLLRAAT
jgi:hypothetical protein